MIIFGVFALGLLLGMFWGKRRIAVIFLDKLFFLLGYSLIVLAVFLTVSSNEFYQMVPRDILKGLCLGIVSIMGSTVFIGIAILIIAHFFNRSGKSMDTKSPTGKASTNRILIGNIVAVFLGLLGGTIGIFDKYRQIFHDAMNVILFLLVLIVGIQVGVQLYSYWRVRKSSAEVVTSSRTKVEFIVFPLMIVFGSLIAAATIARSIDMHWRHAMMTVAPMGWYSLGGPLILKYSGERLASIAILANIFRDLLSVVLIPLLGRTKVSFLALGPGGATTMDMLLPTTVASIGSQHVLLATWVGGCCAFLAPILIILLS